MPIQVTEEDFHDHLKARMSQRGVTREEVERTFNMVGKQPMRNVVR